MPEIKMPVHPDGRQCRKCVNYLFEQEQEIVLIPENGPGAGMAKSQAVAAGVGLVGRTIVRSAPCTALPNWSNQFAQSWCGALYSFASNRDADDATKEKTAHDAGAMK